ETGRPETSKEFAARVHGKFVLKGPRQRTEGEGAQDASTQHTKLGNSSVAEPGLAPWLTIRISPKRVSPEPNTEIPPSDFSEVPRDVDLVQFMSSTSDSIDLVKEIRARYSEDTFFSSILVKPQEFRNFTVDKGLVYLTEKNKKLLCIPKGIINGRSIQEVVISEAHSLLAHLGANKTIDYLKDHVWWK
ncbi:hypothetical protein CPC08DRAFT_612805, partial [Agrocybe pediades]